MGNDHDHHHHHHHYSYEKRHERFQHGESFYEGEELEHNGQR